MKIAAVLALVLSLVYGSVVPGSARPHPDTDYAEAASKIVGNLVSHQYDAIVGKFNARLKGELTASRIAQVWQSVIDQYGSYLEQQGNDLRKQGSGTAVIVRCRMERGSIDVEVVYDDDGLIGGLWIRPADPARNIKPPT